jgi:hypothetical protein
MQDMNPETNAETPTFWPRPLATTAEHFRPTWQQWRDRQFAQRQFAHRQFAQHPLDQDQPPTPEVSGHQFSLDAFTPRELNRLRFLRWLVGIGRLTP